MTRASPVNRAHVNSPLGIVTKGKLFINDVAVLLQSLGFVLDKVSAKSLGQ